jgi:hypothetical protein
LGAADEGRLARGGLCGGNPIIPFKHNASHGQGGKWSKMLAYREEFMRRFTFARTSKARSG